MAPAPTEEEERWHDRYYGEGGGPGEEAMAAGPTRHLVVEDLLLVSDVRGMSEAERREFVSAMKRKLDGIFGVNCCVLALPLPRVPDAPADGEGAEEGGLGAVCLASFASVAVAEKAREKFAALPEVRATFATERVFNDLFERKGSVCWNGRFYQTSSGPALRGDHDEEEEEEEEEAQEGASKGDDGDRDHLATSIAEEKRLGNAAFAKAHFPLATHHYTRALDAHSRRARGPSTAGTNTDSDRAGAMRVVLLCNRSASFLQTGLAAKALGDAEEARRLRPGWAKAHVRRGEALAAAKKLAAARESFREAARLDPAFADKVAAMDKRMAALANKRNAPAGAGAGATPAAI